MLMEPSLSLSPVVFGEGSSWGPLLELSFVEVESEESGVSDK